jgi:DNA-binding CsgD family transcriptional regulator
LIFFVLNKQKEKHETEKSLLLESNKKREKEHLIHAEASKEEITRLQNEKLLAELNYKNQELTSFTYHLVNKNELISEITDVVNKLEHKLVDQPEIKKELKQITKLTEQNSDVDTDWQNFVKSFDQVHTNFYKRLNEEFKDLSPNDYKLCTYLRMNLATKEIASLMNISIRSVETNRYRLRKKLGLDSDTNLSQFLMNY